MIYKKPHAHGTYICTKEMPLEITQGKSTCILLIQYCNIKKILDTRNNLCLSRSHPTIKLKKQYSSISEDVALHLDIFNRLRRQILIIIIL